MNTEEIIEKIQTLSKEELEFYQKLLNFFDFLGLSKKDLTKLVVLVKSWDELVTKINAIIDDQKFLNEKLLNNAKPEEPKVGFDPIKEFNTERQKLNIYGK